MKVLAILALVVLAATVAFAPPGPSPMREVQADGNVTVTGSGFGVMAADYAAYVQQTPWGRTLTWTWGGNGGGAQQWDSVGGVPASGTLRLNFTGSEVEVWYEGLMYDSRPGPPSSEYAGWWLSGAGTLDNWLCTRQVGVQWGTGWDNPADLLHFLQGGTPAVVSGSQLRLTGPGSDFGRFTG